MKYIRIPIKSIAEGKQIAEEHFGSMMWQGQLGSILAYPYDTDNPVEIIDNRDHREQWEKDLAEAAGYSS